MNRISAPPEGSPSPTLPSKHFTTPPAPQVMKSVTSGDAIKLLGPVVPQPSALLRKDMAPTLVSMSDGDSPPGPPTMNPGSVKKGRMMLDSVNENAPASAPSPLYLPAPSPPILEPPEESPQPPPPPPILEPPEESPQPPPPPPPPQRSYSQDGTHVDGPSSSAVFGGSDEESNPVPPSTHSSNTGVVVGVTVGVVVLVLAALIAAYFFWFKKRQRGTTNRELDASDPPKIVTDAPEKLSESSPAITSGQSKNVESSASSVNVSSSSTFPPGTPKARSTDTFAFQDILEATSNFSKNNLLGQGGFGPVYKGVLSSGKLVAIKQLKTGSHQGEREFAAEIEIISHIHHRNLVSLVGFSIQGSQRLLVYEFMANNSLAYHLHAPEAETLAWDTRMQIAIGSAKGLAYLHEDCEPKIIHRDIKATNILLDSNFKAKVSDFGLAKFVAECETHITTRVMGTFGYLAPEYASSGKLTDKSDVYSFGVVLLEIISGREAIDLIEWARPLMSIAMEYDVYDELVDPKLEKQYNNVDMKRIVACAAACVRPYANERPQMIEVARVLEGFMSTDDLKVKPKEYSSNAFNLLKHDPRVAGIQVNSSG